jgi:hypothetical protein
MAFKEGFSGCLGVGCAIVFMLVAIPVGCVILAGIGAKNLPATPVAKRTDLPRSTSGTKVTGTTDTKPEESPRDEEAVAPTREEETDNSRPTDLVVSDAAAVYAAYEENEVKADIDMKNKYFAVKGRIESIGKDILNTPYVALKNRENSIFRVQCMFTDSDQERLANVSTGQMVVIAGKCMGKMGNVIMRDCWFYDATLSKQEQERQAKIAEVNRKMDEARQKEREKQREQAEKARTRTWTSGDGRFSVDAKFVKSNPTTVTLEKSDGSIVHVPLERLCDEDREFIKKGGWKTPLP